MARNILTMQPAGDHMASMLLVSHAVGALERVRFPSAHRRGPRHLGYVPFDGRQRIHEVLSLSDAEQEQLRLVREDGDLSARRRERRVQQLTMRFHRAHLDVFMNRMLAQKLCLAEMQVRARRTMESAMVNEHGETLADALDRANDYRQAAGGIRHEESGELLPRSEYDVLFPEGTFRIAEHRVTASSLHALVEETAEAAHLPAAIVADYRAMYSAMARHSQNVDAFRQDHPNDRKLFRACFGFFPKGDIQIIHGPFGLYIRCSSLDDYAKAYVDNRGGKPASARQRDRAGRTNGVALGGRARFPEQVRLGLTLEQNADERLFVGEPVGVYGHEEDHVYNRFFNASWMHARSTFPPRRSEAERPGCTPLERSRDYMRDALEICRILEIEPDGKDEILARYMQGQEPIDIRDTLLETGRGGFYDFIGRHRDDIRDTGATKASPFTVGRLLREQVDEPYHRSVRRAAEALERLTAMENQFGRRMLSELLRIEPLEQWPRLVRHLERYF